MSIISRCSLTFSSLKGQHLLINATRRTLFGRSTKKTTADDFDEGETSTVSPSAQISDEIPTTLPTMTELAKFKTRQYVSRLVTCRPYSPPKDVEQIIYRLANETVDNFKNEEKQYDSWFNIPLRNPLNKYHLLTKCMKELQHIIPNMTLNDLNILKDVINYFSTEVKDTNVLEDLQRSPDLPKNIHVQLDPVRFTPETSAFFNGRDAFPKRSTKVIDLWYKKKYPSFPKNQDDPFIDNIY
ncbi:unnamed protein product [Didymodactylos carnosus]|uniref:Large ribosomal subunit protein mL50 n=1 Tax=Didymodactylos carnosus TaxID=1234261 RepID=A0A814JLD8_9BILA|nr:unnamed protein product [Didymodactylos carnosus]CAF1039300.1 unnamed protein product [Didymodactylos carnosus]CAF3523722.1 unnamed protein product [Didymodactylos carnosus]CAF3809619.1 unnamed protein product [Didymodactylos carnosus]